VLNYNTRHTHFNRITEFITDNHKCLSVQLAILIIMKLNMNMYVSPNYVTKHCEVQLIALNSTFNLNYNTFSFNIN